MSTTAGVVQIQVNKPDVDLINVYFDSGVGGWKTDGRKAGKLVPPDMIQDHFEHLIWDLARYVDDDSVWTDATTGEKMSPWAAIKVLSGVADTGRECI